MMRAAIFFQMLLSCLPGCAQTTEALVTGRILDAIIGVPLANAVVRYSQLGSGVERAAAPGPDGVYVLPLLPPGRYRIRVEAGKLYQPREAASIEIPVAGLIKLDFALRPITDLWEAGQFRSVFLSANRTSVNFYGPDVDFSRSGSFLPPDKQETRIDSSVSTVITPREIDRLPFAGRDVYAALVLQPGVSSSTTTARGLGISANGQRAGAANYLLDGVDNNAYLITGPQVLTAVEAVQEYRVSLENYSAEYGGTSGFIANAITQSGLNGFHGLGYVYLMNDALNANDISRRYAGLPRAPYKQLEPGFRVGGPLLGNRLFGSASLDRLRTRGFSPCQPFVMPSAEVTGSPDNGGASAFLLSRFHSSGDTGCIPESRQSAVKICAQCSLVHIRPTESVNRTTALARFDSIATTSIRLLGRLALSRLSRPDYSFSPYSDFTSGLEQNVFSLVEALEATGKREVHEARLSYDGDTLAFDRSHPEFPSLQSDDGVSLPSRNLTAGFRNRGRTLNGAYNFLLAAGNHVFKVGAGFLVRDLFSQLDASGGSFSFNSFAEFVNNAPERYDQNVSRIASNGNIALLDIPRHYRYTRGNLFAQDSWRVKSRLVLSGGLRYEYMGSPVNVGKTKDTLVELPQFATAADRIAHATLPSVAGGDQPVYRLDPSAWSVRSGIAYALRSDGRTVFRAGFGTFHDTPFDNLWINVQENQYERASANLKNMPTDYLHSPGVFLLMPQLDSYQVVSFDSDVRVSLVKSGFLAVDQTINRNWHVETVALKSASSHLFTTDEVNRRRGRQRPNPALPPVLFRSSSGESTFQSLSIRTSYRTARLSLQASYTLGVSHDNQSDPLAGDFDLLQTQTQQSASAPGNFGFPREFQPATNYGHSDFDQRHNLVLYGIWNVPGPFPQTAAASTLRGWSVAGTAAIRSGTPFSVRGNTPTALEPLRNNRANLTCQSGYLIERPLPVGRLLLNPDCFEAPDPGAIGNTARNEFYGPGAWNFDFSLSRTFRPTFVPERSRIVLRADAYNLFNHANLGNPETHLTCTADLVPSLGCPILFGQALYGRGEQGSYFPAAKPFVETGRQIQLMLRFEF